MKDCKKCNLHRFRKNVVPGDGPVPCDIMLVGEAPGRDEDLLGKPFVGAAGRILKEALKEAGYTRESVYITNIIKCRPPNNRRPRADEIDACTEHLFNEITRVNPKRIILLGRTASGTFKKHFPMYERFISIYSVYHPAYALHAGDMKGEVIRQIVEALG